MKKQPYFSVVIPTYNRRYDLQRAIKCLLMQTYINYEIIICDNAPSPDTENLVNSFRDGRVKYYSNDINIGFIKNVQKGIAIANGKYIILHGDDDFIIWENCFERLHNILEKGNPGFVRLSYLSFLPNKNNLFKFDNSNKKDLTISANLSNKKIIEFIDKIDPFFISGLIFKKKLIKGVEFINSEWAPWIPLIFQSIKQEGGLYISNSFFIGLWSELRKAHESIYYVSDEGIKFENYLFKIKEYLSEDDYNCFLDKYMNKIVGFLPVVKYSTDNMNVIRFTRRLLEISPKQIYNLKLWIFFILSLMVPQSLLSKIRLYLINIKKTPNIEDIGEIRGKIKLLFYNKI